MEGNPREYRQDNPFAPQQQGAAAGPARQYRPDNPFADSGQSATEPLRLPPVRVMAERPTPQQEPDVPTTPDLRAPADAVARHRPAPPLQPSISAREEPGFFASVGRALKEGVKNKYRDRALLPGTRTERAVERAVSQHSIYGEREGQTPEQIMASVQQSITEIEADEAQWSNRIGHMVAEFVDPSMLVVGAAAERAVMVGLEKAATKGIPLAGRLVELAKIPEGARLVRRLIARATHGAVTGGAVNVAAQTTATIGDEHRLPTAGEAAMAFGVGTVAGPVLEGAATAIAAPFRAAAARGRAAGALPVAPRAPTAAAVEGPGIRRRIADAIDPEGAQERRTAQRRAETDPLTGHGNRAAFDHAKASAEAEGADFVVFDLNNLKAANDLLGHEQGDQFIGQAASAMARAAHESGLPERIFRLGGDEFAMIVPKGAGDKVRTAVETIYGTRPAGEFQVSISGSVGRTFSDADAALQGAKQARKQGKNYRGLSGETPAPSNIVRMPTEQIIADPARFQFKSLGAEGVSGELKGVTKFNERLAGVISAWRDPADGRVYVVNGHHRLELAKRLGQKDLNVQFIDAPNAQAARAEGAIINIAEGRGTAVDAAKVMRDMGATAQDLLDDRGVSLRGQLARDGLALSKLAPDVFDQVATAKVPQGWGVAIGEMLDDAVLQREALAAARGSGKRLSQTEVRELAGQVRDAGTESLSQESLFGTEAERRGLFVQRAQLAAAIQKRLAGDKRLFGFVSKEGRAEDLSRAGGTKIDVDAARGIAEGSARSEEIFDRLYTRSGPIADIVNEGARRIARGEKPATVAADIYPAIGEAVGRELDQGLAVRPHPAERPVPQGARTVADELAVGEEAGAIATSTDPAQEGMFSPARRAVSAVAERDVPDSAFNGDLAQNLERTFFSDDFTSGSVELLAKGFTPDEVRALEKAGLATQGRMSRQQWAAYDAERGRRLSAPRGPSRAPAVQSAESSAVPRGTSAEPERIVAAASRTSDGRIFQGPTHGEAMNEAESVYGRNIAWRDQDQGFLTSSGRFVSREEAYALAERGALFETRLELSEEGSLDAASLMGGRQRMPVREVESLALTAEPEGPAQASMFGGKEGTTAARNLAQSESAARSELEALRQRFALEKDPVRRASIARDITERERLVNRGSAISAEEMQTRAAAEEQAARDTDGQLALLSPDVPAAYRAKLASAGTAVPTAAEQAEVRTLMEVSRKLAEAVGVPLRQGRFRAALRQASGVFFPRKEVTRVTRFDKLDTVAHEVGHYISKKYLANPTMRSAKVRGQGRQPIALPAEAVRELHQMGKDLYGSRKPAGGYGEEGVAEWVSFYVTEPATLAQKAPNFTAWMDQNVLHQEPMLRAALAQAREAFQTYQKAPAAQRFDAQIAVGERERFAITFRDYMRVVWDDTYDVKAAVKELGGSRAPADDASILARLSRGAWGEAEEWLRRGVRDIATADDRISAGIHETFAPIVRAGRAQELRRYLDAESALERWENGIDPGFARADAEEIVRLYQGDAQIRAAGEAAWAHSLALLQMRRDVGLITAGQFDQIVAKNKRRVGFYRVFEPEETASGRGGGAGGLGSSGIKRQTGSARRVVDPIEAIIRDTYVTSKKVRQHQAMKALVDHALETEGGGRLIEEVPAPVRPVTIPAQKLQQQLADLGLVYEGVDAKTGRKFTAPIGSIGGHELDALLMAFQDARIAGAAERKDLVFPMLRGGELKWYNVKDRALYDAMVGLGPVEMRLWERILSGPKRLLQTGATTTLEFGFGNIARDIVGQSVFSRGPWRPPLWRHMEGLWHALRRDPVYQRYKLHGADQASMGGVDRGNLQLTSRRLFGYFRTLKQGWLDRSQAWQRMGPVDKALTVHGDFWQVVTTPFEALRAVKEISETMGRVGEFAGVERQALKAGSRQVDASTEAALGARDVGIDFQQLGTATRQVNHIVAFFGAHIRGMAQLGREFRARPGVVIPRVVATVTVPSLALYYLQREDPVYRDLPAWKRDLFWVYVDRGTDQGEGWDGYGTGKVEHVWMFPKPFELGILFGTLPERAAEWHDQSNPEPGRAIAEALKRGSVPSFIPTAAVPLIENYANRSTFRDRPIVPRSRERLIPSEQFAAHTGETARAIGDAVDYSPAKIENLIRGYTGGAGMYVTSGINAVIRGARSAAGLPPMKGPERPEEDALVDVPGLRRFMSRVPGEDAESVARLYREYDEAEQLRLTWRMMMKEGRMAEARAHFREHQKEIMAVATKEEAGQPGALRVAYQNMQQLQQVRRVVEQDPNNRRAVVDAMRRLGTMAQNVTP